MKKKHIIYTLSTIPLTIALCNVNDSNAFFRLDSFISRNKAVSDVVNIRDNNLLKAINNQLGRGEVLDSVTIADMERLTTLNAQERDIFSIEGLEYAINLRTLYLYNNKISDISALSNLTNLTKLYLYNNQISSISALSNLTNLTELSLHHNQISNISVLSNLTNLNKLLLLHNQISDISPLKNLINLTHLDLQNNQISDISALRNLTKLNILYLEDNQISNISALSNLTKLNILYLYNNQISNISALSNLTNLTKLYLQNNQISSISALSNLTNLTELDLQNNQISSISALSNLTNLTELSLHHNQISNISVLSNLTNLNKLLLLHNQISDISPLKNLINLTHLDLQNNQISDISALRNLTKLNILYLEDNQISNISALSNLTKLNILYLYNNQISNISPIKNLENLNTLNLVNQKPLIEAGEFKSETDTIDVSINNPIIGLNSKNLNVSSISSDGIYENEKLNWNNLPLGSHSRTFDFSENIIIGSATATFNGTATLNLNVVDGGAPEPDHISDFDNSDFKIYTTVTANDLGVGVDYLIHKGVRQSLPYRFKYDILEPTNNIVEVYDLVGNKAEYQVKLKDSDIPAIEEGLDALVNKSDSGKEDISYFRKIINNLDESMNKDLLQDKLNNIYPKTLTLDRELATSNIDVYIKSENILQMALDTNSITFEDFSGVEDVIKENIVNVTINSSLPYSLNAYLPAEIQNADKTNIMDKSILNIKENSESIYQVFPNTTDKLVLKDNCSAGNDLVHGIDIKLKGGIAHEKDVYKTTIKFEAEQK